MKTKGVPQDPGEAVENVLYANIYLLNTDERIGRTS